MAGVQSSCTCQTEGKSSTLADSFWLGCVVSGGHRQCSRMLSVAADPHPRVAFLSCRPSTGAKTGRIPKCSQSLRRPPSEASTQSRTQSKAGRERLGLPPNDRCQLGIRHHRTCNRALAENHRVPRLRPATRTKGRSHRRAIEAPPDGRGLVDRVGREPDRCRSRHMGEVGKQSAPTRGKWLARVYAFLGEDPRPLPATSGDWIKRQREAVGWSQRELAKRLGVYPTTVERWELGQRRPAARHLAKVESLLGVVKHRAPDARLRPPARGLRPQA
jgi:hypothetical protein